MPETQLSEKLAEQIMALISEACKTIAIIGKTDRECERIGKLLHKQGLKSWKRLSADHAADEGGVVLMPAHLAKGLQFDAVLLRGDRRRLS
ncbi:MAG: hypothetical protein U5J83_13630 [Bryobacterales bacterium]|nr:hypothetical protein [Bryobacterales bacterium]